jgi:nitroreductase
MTDQQDRAQQKAGAVPFPVDAIDGLLATAARAPSILNTQPWLFRITTYTIELYADRSRKLSSDLTAREMLMSCGAALFGLRLAIRGIGYQPVVSLLPEPERPEVLAAVRLGKRAPLTDAERMMIGALPHRHTHRGAYAAGPLPQGLLIALQHDAVAEQAALALVDRTVEYTRLAGIVARATRTLSADGRSRADVSRWVRPPGSSARDGIPASAIAASARPRSGGLAQRDLARDRHDFYRDKSLKPAEPGGAPPAATGILLTSADTKADWLRAGQALHRILTHAATYWVFATLYSQPLESAQTRALIRSTLGLPGAPHVLLEFGLARITRPTARRPPEDIMMGERPGRPPPSDNRAGRRLSDNEHVELSDEGPDGLRTFVPR